MVESSLAAVGSSVAVVVEIESDAGNASGWAIVDLVVFSGVVVVAVVVVVVAVSAFMATSGTKLLGASPSCPVTSISGAGSNAKTVVSMRMASSRTAASEMDSIAMLNSLQNESIAS